MTARVTERQLPTVPPSQLSNATCLRLWLAEGSPSERRSYIRIEVDEVPERLSRYLQAGLLVQSRWLEGWLGDAVQQHQERCAHSLDAATRPPRAARRLID